MSELVTRAQQVAVVDGVRLDGVSNILVGEQVAKLPFARARGRLYVLVEPLGDRAGWEGLCREIAQAVHDEYYYSSGSVTAGLRRALERANTLLCDMNVAEARRAPRLAGISAVVIKGNDVFIAQTGPALVYVVRKGASADDRGGALATRFPDDSPWLDMSPRQAMEEGYAPPIGLSRELSVDLFHTQLSVGDRVVVAESRVSSFLDEDEVAETFGADDPESTRRLQALFADRDLSLLVIRADSGDGTPGERGPRRLGPLSEMTIPPVSSADRAPSSVADEAPSVRGVLRDLGTRVARMGAYAAEQGRVIWRRMLPGSDRSRAARERRRRGRGLSVAPATVRRPADDRLVLIGMLAGVAVLALAGYGLLRWQGGRVQAGRYERAIQAVQTKLADARSASSPEVARQALYEADVLLTRAMENPVAGAEAAELSKQLGDELDALDRVVRLYWLPVLREYADLGTLASDVLIHGIDIYSLDVGLGRVYKHLFNPLMDGLQDLGADVPEVLLRTGDARDGLTVGRLRGMTWMPPGPGREWGSLLVLEESGALLEYEPSSGIRVLPAAARARLQDPRAIAGYEGRLLVLDAKANQILVFEPGSGSYDVEPVPYTNADLLLSGVVDMAVDGDVYLLYADGLVVKLRGGEQTSFELSGLHTRIRNPVAISVTPDVPGQPGYVYIADAGNARVVQFTKDGQFVRQFRPKRGDDSFAGLTGLFVDEEAHKMVVLSGNRLLLANVPTE
ncbi:MAG: hypothetical protein HPY83_17070 [Anaerolineae bacterium]|nr:hypothetical protein [Anaerolineae bacterium]